MKKMFAMLLALALLFGCAAAEGGEVTCTVASVAADGTAALDTTVEALEAQGFALGDVVSVIAGGIVCTMPFVGEDADVDAGAMLLRGGSGVPELAIAGGAFTGICPIAPGDTVTLWYGYSLAEVTGSSSQLGAPAAQLGVKNLLVKVPSSSTLDAAAREELTLSLTEAGVEHLVIRDDAASYFE